MTRTVVDDQGNEIEMLTQEEVQAQIAAREAELKAQHEAEIKAEKEHQAEKLRQFQQAQKGIENKESEIQRLAEEAKQAAEEAKQAIANAEKEKIITKTNLWIESIVGGNPELVQKVKENYELLAAMPSGTDEEIKARIQKAVNASGFNNMGGFRSMPSFSGAVAPNMVQTNEQEFIQKHNAWKDELGLGDFIPKS